MTGTRVLDSWALMCFLEQEAGHETVIDLFEQAAHSSRPLLMCVVNWGEVYYQVMRRLGEAKAQEIERLIRSFPIDVVNVDQDLTREAVRFKATTRMAYVGCFAAAIAKVNKADLVTGDKAFKQIESDVKILWV